MKVRSIQKGSKETSRGEGPELIKRKNKTKKQDSNLQRKGNGPDISKNIGKRPALTAAKIPLFSSMNNQDDVRGLNKRRHFASNFTCFPLVLLLQLKNGQARAGKASRHSTAKQSKAKQQVASNPWSEISWDLTQKEGLRVSILHI
jgi:hypothetical protein